MKTSLQGHGSSVGHGADVADADKDEGGTSANAACGTSGAARNTRNMPTGTHDLGLHIPMACGRQRCSLCDKFDADPVIIGHVNGKTEKIKNDRNCDLNCATDNCVYLLECDNCKVQYVGETSQKLSDRFSGHKYKIKHFVSDNNEKNFLAEHFNIGSCRGKTYSCRILETIPYPAKKNGKLDPVTTKYRHKREDYWMEKLQTIYPYGLNNRHGKNKDQHDERNSVKDVFIPRKPKKKRTRRFRRRKEFTSGEAFYEELTSVFTGEEESMDPNVINNVICRALKNIPQLRRKEAQKMGELAVADMIRENWIPIRILHIIADLTLQKMNGRKHTDLNKGKKSFDRIAFVVGYRNQGIGMIGLGGILDRKDVRDCIPPAARDKKEPMLVYRYDPPIRNRLFNYQKTCDEYIEGQEEDMQCDCDNSVFKDKDHNHVVTGDLNIIENPRLRDLFHKGPNYRERKPTNWNRNILCIKDEVRAFIKKWSNSTGISESCFQEWSDKVIQRVMDKIERLKIKTKFKPTFPVLRDKDCLEELNTLQDKYVLTPIDKAGNNIGFICKKFYLETIKKEVCSDTYEVMEETSEEVMDYVREECSNVGVPVYKSFKDLPSIHATLKMHKDPVKFRYIIGSTTSVLKPLAKQLVQILKLVMNCMRNYCDKVKFYTGFNRYWIVENNEVVLENINRINSKNRGRNIECFDFSTLYTKIDPDDLKDKLKEIVGKAYKGGQNQYLRVSKNHARWSNSPQEGCYTKERVESMIDILVDNSFFKFGDSVYRQKIGIPMGVDPAPQMANLYLFYYEYTFMEKLAKEDGKIARKFNNTSRFIDDLITLNNDGVLGQRKQDIYPKELVCNKENLGDQTATFLDMETNVVGKQFVTKTYDKREAYNFEIVNYPDLSGNIPPNAAYGVYTSQVIRYARVCSNKDDFLSRVKLLKGKLKEKGFLEAKLIKTGKRCLHKNHWIQRKYKDFQVEEFHHC